MGIEALIATVIGLAGATGGYVGGRRTGLNQSFSVATDTVGLLQVQVDTLSRSEAEKTAVITDLRARVELLEQLVTQRAKVEEVYTAVEGVRTVVDQIKEKVDGCPRGQA